MEATAANQHTEHLAEHRSHNLDPNWVRLLDTPAFPSHPDLDNQPIADQLRFAGGDDFQLLFTANEIHRPRLAKLAEERQIVLSRIGIVTREPQVLIKNKPWPPSPWSHFKAEALS